MNIEHPAKLLVGATLAALVVGSIFYLNSQKAPRFISGDVVEVQTIVTRENKSSRFEPAKEITSPDGFINTEGEPITIGEFVGKKVVLLDIWTYTCINCQRTTPYLNAWYEKYKDQGLVIIGLHTPEFEFEKVYQNVLDATKRLGIKYPVVLDNDYSTWNAYQNRFWPRKYLIDIDGFVVYDHIGEGNYEETEAAIQRALMERAVVLGGNSEVRPRSPRSDLVASTIPEADLSGIGSPEAYFGSLRNEYLANGNPGTRGVQEFTIPENLIRNALYLGGTWNMTPEYAESKGKTRISYRYNSKDVYLVASAPEGVKITVLRDGKPVGEFAGEDIDSATSIGIVREQRLYKLVHDVEPGERVLEIEIEGAGFHAYAFTFG